ncbi:MAG: phosphatase [Selenomonadaceae bacterium]|nr:phosphatase [Selenomonadaceae bacterium]
MKDLLDVHTHTTASGHAYSTLRENISMAKAKGLELVGISDHAPHMPGSAHEYYFLNFHVIPRDAYGIKLIMGAELNIIDYCGSTDLSARALNGLDYAIASLHNPCIESGNVEENTAALIGAMRNPHVVIIGHPDNPRYPVDFDKLAKAAVDNKVLLEVNNNSYDPKGYRVGSRENARLMLAACKKFGAEIIMGSDAHIDFDVGNHTNSQEILRENNFPAELVVNYDVEKFLARVNFRKSLTPS